MKYHAIVVGSNGPPWQSTLKFAVDDANRISRALESSCGFTVTNLPPDCEASEAQKLIAKTTADCERGDSLILYFSGHGELIRGKLYLLLDGTSNSVYDSSINAHHLVEYMQLSKASHKLIILDCCHAGGAAGFKGAEIIPLDQVGDSELVLCAGDKLDRAREIKHLAAGFMTYHICEILNSEMSSVIPLNSLLIELQRRSHKHNAENPIEKIPIPFLFGRDPSNFLIKRQKGEIPILVQFEELDSLDTETLFNTIRPYLKWNKVRLKDVPFNIKMPNEFGERIETLSRYVTTDIWPCEVEEKTKGQIRELKDTLIPRLNEDLVKAAQMAIKATTLPDRSDLDQSGKTILELYVRSKFMAVKRQLAAFWLNNEAHPEWQLHISKFDTVWSDQIIHGLTLVSNDHDRWAFWTDADWYLENGKIRIFVPQFFGGGDLEVKKYDNETYLRCLIPQLLASDAIARMTSLDLDILVHQDHRRALGSIRVRGEQFIETESHNSPNGNEDTKQRAARVTSDILVEHFEGLADVDRRKWAFKLVRGSHILDGIGERVRKRIPNIREYLNAPKLTSED